MAALNPDEQPANSSTEGLGKVPQVESVTQGSETGKSPHLGSMLVFSRRHSNGGIGARVKCRLGAFLVRGVGKRPYVKYRKQGHLNTEE